MAKILVTSPTPSHPQDAGNRARIFSLLRGLQEAGHQIHFAFVKMETGNEPAMSACWDGFYPLPYRRPACRFSKRIYDKIARRFGSVKVLPFLVDDWYGDEISDQLITLRDQLQPDVILVEYVYLSKAFECFGTDTLKILDTHDLFGNRHKIYIENGQPPVFFYTSLSEERRGLQRADLVLAIQKKETEYFSRQTSSQVLTVGHMAMPQNISPGNDNDSPRLLFVGSRNHINVDAIQWFIEEVLPAVRHKIPEVELDIVGGCVELLKTDAQVNLIGRVDELLPYYAHATVVVNPLRFGTGLKIKTLEALSMPRPLVTTSVGAAGLDEWRDRAFLIADTPTQFADEIIKLIRSEDHCQKLCQGADQFIASYNLDAIAPLLGALQELQKKCPKEAPVLPESS